MKDFENKCEELDIPLFILPPRSPKYNDNVEISNIIVKDEFYKRTFFLELRVKQKNLRLKKYLKKYNRPLP